MSSKSRFWNHYHSWEEAEEAWDEKAKRFSYSHPIKSLKNLPNIPGITDKTKKNLKFKSFKYMIQNDTGVLKKNIMKHPFKYGFNYLKSVLQKETYRKDQDFFFYNLKDEKEFTTLINSPDTLFVLGFSYCHKPFECPSGRFTDQCIHESNNPVCSQCFIGKCTHSVSSENSVILNIPTIHYIGEKIFELSQKHPTKRLVFLITACELTLKMFSDWGNMVGISGIGVRLDGRICNTMKAFDLSENGIKPGLTVVTPDTQKRILKLFSQKKTVTYPINANDEKV